MSDFTIEQLEAMQEKITPGERYLYEDDWDGLMVVNDDGRDMTFGDQLRVKVEAGHPEHDGESIVAIPKLISALIAEKRNHDDLRQEIGSLIGKLETRAENAHSNRSYTSAVAFRESARDLTRILEADNADQT